MSQGSPVPPRPTAAVLHTLTLMKLASALMVLNLQVRPVQAAPDEPARVIGQVTRVSDGDTLWVRPGPSAPGERRAKPLKIRIDGIDAPERCQPWGRESTEALRTRLMGRTVEVDLRGRDDYRRWLGRVEHDGDDVAAWLVREGHAWSYHYRHGAGAYAALERQARERGAGLFAQPDPMPPGVFRRWHGPCE